MLWCNQGDYDDDKVQFMAHDLIVWLSQHSRYPSRVGSSDKLKLNWLSSF